MAKVYIKWPYLILGLGAVTATLSRAALTTPSNKISNILILSYFNSATRFLETGATTGGAAT